MGTALFYNKMNYSSHQERNKNRNHINNTAVNFTNELTDKADPLANCISELKNSVKKLKTSNA